MTTETPQDTQMGRAADQVVAAIEQRIHTGSIAEGQPLPPERDLMEEFGISRTVVREAVRILSSRGLITARPRHRPVVRKPGYDAAFDALGGIVTNLLTNADGIKNLFETRRMIEAALARQAALQADKDDIAELKAMLDLNGAALDDNVEFYATDKAFHRVLYKIPRNPVLPAIHKAYTTWLEPQWSKMPRQRSRNEANFAAHTQIYEAILSRDPDQAEAEIVAHLNDAWKQVCSTFDL